MDRNPSETAGMPHTILDLLIDTLTLDMRPFPVDAELRDATKCLVYRTFWSMTLVHRSWTNAARRGLWRRAVIYSDTFSAVLREPVRCSQLQELAVIFTDDSLEEEALFVDILRLSPSIRTLFIEYAEDRGVKFYKVLDQLHHQTNLKRLWIFSFPIACIEEVCTVVANHPNLKSLLLDCGEAASDGNLPRASLLDQIGPPAQSLQSVAIIEPLDWVYVTWLLQPQAEKGISNFVISLENPADFEQDPELIERFYECLPRLQSLHVLISNTRDGYVEHLQNETLKSFLFMATNLRQLTLSISDVLYVRHLHLPGSLRRLHIHADMYVGKLDNRYSGVLEYNDDSISSILKGWLSSSTSSSPRRLDMLIISFVGSADVLLDKLPVLSALLSKTREVCLSMEATLSFEVRESAYLGDIAEDAAFTD